MCAVGALLGAPQLGLGTKEDMMEEQTLGGKSEEQVEVVYPRKAEVRISAEGAAYVKALWCGRA